MPKLRHGFAAGSRQVWYSAAYGQKSFDDYYYDGSHSFADGSLYDGASSLR
jgi:hypothetical protein